MMRPRVLLSLAAACVLLAGCESTTTISPQPLLVNDPPTQVRVDGYDLTMDAYLWRDFQPIAPRDGRPLAVTLHIRTVDGRPFPAGVTADQVTVVFGEQSWTTAPARVDRPAGLPSIIDVLANEGPKWGPGANANLVVRLRDAAGREHWLGARDQPIRSTH